jgi:hypothetical protein
MKHFGLGFAASATPHFMDVLREELHCAPALCPSYLVPRLVAAEALKVIAESDPAARRTMADAGAMGLVLAFIAGIGTAFKDKLVPAYQLASVLLRWEPAAFLDLQHAICGPSVDLAYPSIDVFAVCYHALRLNPILCES